MNEIAGKGAGLVIDTAVLAFREVWSFIETKDELTSKCKEIQKELNILKVENENNRVKLSAEGKKANLFEVGDC